LRTEARLRKLENLQASGWSTANGKEK